MPEFLFAAGDTAGNKVQGQVAAVDMTGAVAQVAAMGYTLLHIELVGQPEPTPAVPPADYASNRQPPAAAIATTIKPEPVQDVLKADSARRMKVESELTALGMSAEEIRRLVNASASTFEADPNAQPLLVPSRANPSLTPPLAPKSSAKSNRITAASLESFASQLNSANAARSTAAVRDVQLGLPEFRESSTAETIQAETLLRDGSMLRRREKFHDAEAKVREAIFLTPKDAAALELLGDILQGVGKVDEALAAYKRATEADSKRASAERKYGELLMRQQNWNFADPEAVAPNRWLNSILSLCLPGVGQVYNGDWAKAIVFFALDLLCGFLLLYSPWAVTKKGSHVGTMTLALFALTIVTYIAALMDSNITAARKRAN